MTTADTPDTPSTAPTSPTSATSATSPTLRLDEGPLGEAMAAVDRAITDIEEAEAVLVTRRRELSAVLGRELRAVLDAEPDDVVEEVRPALATLYWERDDVIRVDDLTTATGLSGAQLRQVVGPRVLAVPCDGCGTPSEVVQTSRSQSLRSLCPECRWTAPPRNRWGPSAADVPGDALARLVEDLDVAIIGSGCDGRLTMTRAWAVRVGLEPEAITATVEAHGAFCDCEVLDIVPMRYS